MMRRFGFIAGWLVSIAALYVAILLLFYVPEDANIWYLAAAAVALAILSNPALRDRAIPRGAPRLAWGFLAIAVTVASLSFALFEYGRYVPQIRQVTDALRSPEDHYQAGIRAATWSLNHDNDFKEAEREFRLAADRGHVGAKLALGRLYINPDNDTNADVKAARHIFEELSAQGNAGARAELAAMYFEGSAGLKQDRDRALAMFRSAGAEGADRALKLARDVEEGGEEDEHGDWEGSVRLYRVAAERGNAEAEYKIGFFMELAQDSVKATTDDEESAEIREYVRKANASLMHDLFGDDPRNFAIYLQRSADQGYSEAADDLGGAYRDGDGVAKDELKARALFEKACNAGRASSCNNLGVMIGEGAGGAADPYKADELFRRAAAAGDLYAMSNLGGDLINGKGTAQNRREGLEWIKKAASAGNASAMRNLGAAYELGEGTAVDLAKAAEWYRKGADGDDATSANYLGLAYEDGRGVAKDKAMAVQYYRQGAYGGSADAMFNLGRHYFLGEGVSKDVSASFEWMNKAADAGNTKAMIFLASQYGLGDVVAKNDATALGWYRKAADAGDATGMHGVGMYYQYGLGGLPKDPGEAARWMNKAAAAGYKQR